MTRTLRWKKEGGGIGVRGPSWGGKGDLIEPAPQSAGGKIGKGGKGRVKLESCGLGGKKTSREVLT